VSKYSVLFIYIANYKLSYVRFEVTTKNTI